MLNSFGNAYPDAADALDSWYATVCQADWKGLTDIRQTFNSVDYVGDNRYVFNIRGNKYRLVALIFFSVRTVYIKFVGTNLAYDRIDVKTINLS